MGQTLPNGIYLPAEGERNCYDGLEGNWRSLDSLISTVAGKASATHTHGNITNDGKVGTTANVPLITGTGGAVQAGSFGNQANTFCEGNDSRLSDARTPVAHTHTKSDVTDLFNSANTWSASNTYNASNALIIQNNYVSRGSEPSSYQEQQLKWSDTDGNEIARIKYLNQLTSAGNIANGLELATTDKFKDGVRDPTGSIISATFRIGLWNDGTKYIYNECRWRSNLLPFGNNTNDVGSSSYQWNNLYAKNYYYNGVAWGLDKANVWTGSNQFNASVRFSGQIGINWARGGTVGTLPSSVLYYGFQNALDSNDNVFDRIRSYVSTTGTNLQEHIKYAWNDLTKYATINYWINADGSDSEYKLSVKRVIPGSSNETDLGTSTNKWKTLNGINPGALSLPKTDSSITAIEISGFSFDGTSERIPDTVNLFSNGEALVNGWLCARMTEGAGHYIFITSDDNTGKYGISSSCFSSGIVTTLLFGVNAYVPIKAGDKPAIRWAKPNGGNAQLLFYPCFGNV